MRPILDVSNLSKKFRIQHQAGSYLSLRERVVNGLRFEKTQSEDFWALQDLSFDVSPGDSIGIIGRNGAGKSTLLKILSRITPPTGGKVVARGRIASLLEVGTGFHPELTGRENIFFNGSLLGMKRREIQSKFDEIVAFSGTEQFLDTPLKHYSSGMQLRLAFAVASFLEPEILIIDEVLAVGDAEFQRKCIGKMEDVSKSGRTILFVSHNLPAVLNLCKKGIYLNRGRLEALDGIHVVVDKYLRQEKSIQSSVDVEVKLKSLKPDSDFKLHNVSIYQDGQQVFMNAVNGKELALEIDFELSREQTGFRIFLDLIDQFGTVIFRSFHDEDSHEKSNLKPGRYVSRIVIPADFLAPIPYDFKLQFGVHNVRMMEPTEGITFRMTIAHNGKYNKSYHGQYTAGVICPVLQWTTQNK
jgi:lipopolysaccharide transport system ATP-binding protein